MNSSIQIYNNIVTKVTFIIKQLKLKLTKSTGRTLAITPEHTISLAIFKQAQGIETKKSVWEIFEPKCSYKTLVVNMNKLTLYALVILQSILRMNQQRAHLVKHTDSTDIPVCLTKNGKRHKTMEGLATWAHGPKGWYYGVKMSITTDLKRQLLAVRFGTGNSNDRETFKKMNKDLMGVFVADAGYISKDLEREFYIEHKRVLFVKPRANMKKLATEWQIKLYNTRMLIELNFRSLKMFHGLVTSLPRSVDGYLGNYAYSLLAFVLR
ncbi:MAG: Transposase, IS982 family [Parcubacteria group bacterium GW2011_GWA1_47_8]|nr:MAG: Transposase, IS982 family [Parcubacteria group bacterium GW2011_GWA1_47_8]KKW07768.1 MAG: Transposase, IS982 family [Parcubacteria group bacterium GW2011_GWA2_49_16]